MPCARSSSASARARPACGHSLRRHLLGQVGPADTHVLDIDAEIFGVAMQVVAHFEHHRHALVRKGGIKVAQTVDTAERRIELCAKSRFGGLAVARYRLAELAHVLDVVDHESIDVERRTAANLDANIVKVEAQRLLLDDLDAIGIHEGERQLEVDARLRLHRLDLAKAHDDCLLARIDHEDRGISDDKHNGEQDYDSGKSVRCHGSTSLLCRFADLVERQVGNNPLLLIDHDLLGILQHLFHRLEEQALAGHFGSLRIFFVDGSEPLRLTVRFLDDTVLVSSRCFANLGRVASCLAELLVGILVRFFDEALLVLFGALHLFEGIGDIARRRHVLNGDRGYRHARIVTVHRALQMAATSV
ncbi:hypothetical protein AJ87_29165 [Rhizobium yanglingense]|nr:hypothetical protein AJ87_29165 [Rhizobium yanglingense]